MAEQPKDTKKSKIVLAPDQMIKVLNLLEIECPRIKELRKFRSYYKNQPKFPVLDVEDPGEEKPRVAVGYGKDVVRKRAAFLFGDDKFVGLTSVEFEDEAFEETSQMIWDENRCDGKVLSFAKDFYWAGFAAWKVVVQPAMDKLKIRLNRVDPTTLYCEFNPGEDKTKNAVFYWIIMYQKDDGTFYREEIYKDRIQYYTGTLATSQELTKYMGTNGDDGTQAVKFVLDSFEENDLGVFPIAFAARENEDSIWGTSLIRDISDRIDRLNEMYTNALFAISKISDPVLWIKGVKDIQTLYKDADAVWYLENPDASLNILEWNGVPESTIIMIKKLTDQLYNECDLPLLLKDSDQSIGDIPSRSLEILYTDLKAAVQSDRSSMSDWLLDYFEITWNALKVTKDLGKGLTGNAKNYEKFNFERIDWGSIIPVDESKVQADAIELYKNELIDRKTTLQKIGYSEEEADDIIANMKKDKLENDTGYPGSTNDFEDSNKETPPDEGTDNP